MYKISETAEMSDHWNIAVLFNHQVGPIMTICKIKKDIYINVKDLCSCSGADGRKMLTGMSGSLNQVVGQFGKGERIVKT